MPHQVLDGSVLPHQPPWPALRKRSAGHNSILGHSSAYQAPPMKFSGSVLHPMYCNNNVSHATCPPLQCKAASGYVSPLSPANMVKLKPSCFICEAHWLSLLYTSDAADE